MAKLLKSFFVGLMVCLMALNGVLTVSAATNLPDGFCIDDDNGISINAQGEYFMYADRLMPGDVITRKLTLRNLSQEDPFTVVMLADQLETTGLIDWLDNLHLQITMNGQELYAGRLRGDGVATKTMRGNGADMLYQGLHLGEYKMGQQSVLDFVITADAGHFSTEDFIGETQAGVRWSFYAAKEGVGPAEGPKTGEIVRYGLYILLILLMLLCAVFYYCQQRMKGKG